jgi:hypothetical protein
MGILLLVPGKGYIGHLSLGLWLLVRLGRVIRSGLAGTHYLSERGRAQNR